MKIELRASITNSQEIICGIATAINDFFLPILSDAFEESKLKDRRRLNIAPGLTHPISKVPM
jgi:hypothetical protein